MPELSAYGPDGALVVPQQYNAAHDLIARNLQAGRADKIAYIDDAGQYSYAELDQRVNRCANALRTLGVRPEQRVLVCMHDDIDLPMVFLACIKAGIVPILANTLLTANDYRYFLHDSRAVALIVSEPLLPVFESELSSAPHLEHVVIHGAEAQQGRLHLATLLAVADPNFEPADTRCDDPCFWLYSSGSTGAPKGTVHVHGSLIYTADLYARQILGLSEADLVFSAAKLFFAYGLGNSLTFPLAVGATAMLMAERPAPAAVVARMRALRPTLFFGVPTLYAALLASDELTEGDNMGLRLCVSAGEALPAELGKRWRARTGVDILDGIGSTEMLHIFLSNRIGEVRYGTTGRAVPGYTLRLVDEAGADVAPGALGELWVKGPTAANGYWNNRDRSRHTFQGEWTRTGDQYSVDDVGCYVHAGRADDMLKVSGQFVSPTEVESALIAHPSVLEAAVIGADDKDGLTKPMAFVVTQPGHTPTPQLRDALKHLVKERLAPHKYPRWVVFQDSLPKTATGKIQRFKLRARLAADGFDE